MLFALWGVEMNILTKSFHGKPLKSFNNMHKKVSTLYQHFSTTKNQGSGSFREIVAFAVNTYKKDDEVFISGSSNKNKNIFNDFRYCFISHAQKPTSRYLPLIEPPLPSKFISLSNF